MDRNKTNIAGEAGVRAIITGVTLLLAGIQPAKAQPEAVKDAAMSVFTLVTYDTNGEEMATSHGVFVGDNGEAVSGLSPFEGADKAVVTDVKGNRMDVTRMIGVNELYGVAHFRVDGKTTPAAMASSDLAPGAQAWLVPYAEKGKATPVEASVKDVEKFMDKYSYYIFSMTPPETSDACPFVNDAGEVMGLMQRSSMGDNVHATDIRFIAGLEHNGFAFSNATLQKISIPAAMPSEMSQARVMLMMAGQSRDTLKYEAAISDFTSMFPTVTDGYMAKAQLLTGRGLFDEASAVMEEAAKKVTDKGDAHFCYARLMYNKLTSDSRPYEPWTLDAAMEEVQAAYTISPQPVYEHLKAQIHFSKGEHQAAYDIFAKLCDDNDFNLSELLFECAQCKQMLGAANEELLLLLDSAINTTDTMRLNEAAPYFLMRGDIYNLMGNYRQAVFDYTRYAVLTPQMPSAQFYYIKEQAEVKGKLYKQALDDIARAIITAPNEPMYIAEMSSLYLRVNQPENALTMAEKCVEIAPDYSTGHVLHGLSLIKNDRKEEGLEALRKAKELGDPQAQTLIDKYSAQ